MKKYLKTTLRDNKVAVVNLNNSSGNGLVIYYTNGNYYPQRVYKIVTPTKTYCGCLLCSPFNKEKIEKEIKEKGLLKYQVSFIPEEL